MEIYLLVIGAALSIVVSYVLFFKIDEDKLEKMSINLTTYDAIAGRKDPFDIHRQIATDCQAGFVLDEKNCSIRRNGDYTNEARRSIVM